MTAESSSVATVLQAIQGLSRSSFTDDGDRIQVLAAAYALVSRLETPWDTVARLCMNEVSSTRENTKKSEVKLRRITTQPALFAALKVARDFQLFEKWQAKGGHPQTSTELAEMVSCDRFLLCESKVSHVDGSSPS